MAERGADEDGSFVSEYLQGWLLKYDKAGEPRQGVQELIATLAELTGPNAAKTAPKVGLIVPVKCETQKPCSSGLSKHFASTCHE